LSPFRLVGGELHAEGVPLSRIAALHGTPTYVYSRAALEASWRAYDEALAPLRHLVCYAMKANSTLAVLNVFARLGSGFDIVSGGELARVIAAGGDPRNVVFSGVGKTRGEMRAALGHGIRCFNVESPGELDRLAEVASEAGVRAPVSLRVNPDVDARTHPYISTGLRESKFGVDFADALPLYRKAAAMPALCIVGIDMHIGSQITDLAPYREAAGKVLALVDALAREGIAIEHVDVGGGLGIRYRDETPVALADYAAMLAALFHGRRETLVVEPGRRLVADAGVLLSRVEYLKRGALDFAIVDAAMNDLLRPALYDAWHPVDAVTPRADEPPRSWQIVGPVCESADFLARDRTLALRAGDLVAIGKAGAYAMAMSSNYNSRPRAAEVLVDGEAAHLVRRRERVEDLFEGESLPP
jgi:diaminopimelate decarboxylase